MKDRLFKTTTVIVIALAAVAVSVPSVQGRMWSGQVRTSGPTHVQEPGSVSDFDTYDFQEPAGVYETGAGESGAANGFAWGAALVGGAFVLGLCLAAAGARTALCRRTIVERPQAGLTRS